jgi:hypothetical protein
VGKTIITYSKCVFVALGIQYVVRTRRIVLFVTCRSVSYFSLLSHSRCDFQKKVIERKMCDVNFYTGMSKTFLILRRIQQDIVANVDWSSGTVTIVRV